MSGRFDSNGPVADGVGRIANYHYRGYSRILPRNVSLRFSRRMFCAEGAFGAIPAIGPRNAAHVVPDAAAPTVTAAAMDTLNDVLLDKIIHEALVTVAVWSRP